MRAFLALSFLWLTAAAGFAEDRQVVLAAARAGRIEVFDAETLEPLGAIAVQKPLESVTPSPDGRRLYVAQENPKSAGHCCGLFSLDLETHNACLVTAPAKFATPSPGGRFIYTQGSQGVDVFDARTLNRQPGMKGNGAYNLQPSPDGRWLMGISNSPKPQLDVFDLNAKALAHEVEIPAGPAAGAWAGDRYYVFSYFGSGTGFLWSVREDGELSPRRSIALRDFYNSCNQPVLLTLAGARDRLFLAETFGFQVDRRKACPGAAGGGIDAIEPGTGNVHHIADGLYVHRMVAAKDGRALYVIETLGKDAGGTSLVRVDTRSGSTLRTMLRDGGWNLSLASIPADLIPRGFNHPVNYCAR